MKYKKLFSNSLSFKVDPLPQNVEIFGDVKIPTALTNVTTKQEINSYDITLFYEFKPAIADIEATYSFTTDTPDFWRREGQEYPRHGARFTGEPAFFKHVGSATKGLLEKTGYTLDDFNYVVFHQPNGKFPLRMAKKRY